MKYEKSEEDHDRQILERSQQHDIPPNDIDRDANSRNNYEYEVQDY